MTLITVTVTADDGSTGTANIDLQPPAPTAPPPPVGGYMPLTAAGDFPIPAGQFASLPDDVDAAAMVTWSSWEPRPENTAANAARPPAGWTAPPPKATTNPYPPQVWARVTGACPLPHPTTDELIQWCAAKWGLSDELIRAQMVQESHWYQNLKDAAGVPVWGRGYGDHAPGAGNTHGSPDCDPGRQYNQALGGTLIDVKPGRENGPESFGISQCRWWANTDPGPTGFGCYPETELCTSVALDVYGATVRAQYEGWNGWAHGRYDAYKAAPGGSVGVWGAVGNWYSAGWYGTKDQAYVKNVMDFLATQPWLQNGF